MEIQSFLIALEAYNIFLTEQPQSFLSSLGILYNCIQLHHAIIFTDNADLQKTGFLSQQEWYCFKLKEPSSGTHFHAKQTACPKLTIYSNCDSSSIKRYVPFPQLLPEIRERMTHKSTTIMESLNGWGWKGTLQIIHSPNTLLELCPVRFETPLWTDSTTSLQPVLDHPHNEDFLCSDSTWTLTFTLHSIPLRRAWIHNYLHSPDPSLFQATQSQLSQSLPLMSDAPMP